MSSFRDKSDLIITRKGRFIKKDGLLYKACKITPYDFDQLRKVDVLIPDNPRGTVFYHKLHSPIEIEKAVSRENPIHVPLEEQRLAVMMPRNFTDDWMEQKRRANRRTMRKNEEEDDDELYEEEQNEKKAEEKRKKDELEQKEREKSISGPDVKEKEIDKETIETIEKSIKQTLDDTHANQEREQIFDQERIEFEKKIEELEKEKQKWIDQKKQWEEQLFEEKKQFEEKDKRVQDVENVLIQLKDDMSKKKKDILIKAKSHFETLVKAMSQAVLGDEFQKNPHRLEKFIERAIQESIGEEEFKIFGSQDLKKILTSRGVSTIGDVMQVDAHLEGMNFRIESPSGILDTGISSVIEDLLKKVNMDDLFEEGEHKE